MASDMPCRQYEVHRKTPSLGPRRTGHVRRRRIYVGARLLCICRPVSYGLRCFDAFDTPVYRQCRSRSAHRRGDCVVACHRCLPGSITIASRISPTPTGSDSDGAIRSGSCGRVPGRHALRHHGVAAAYTTRSRTPHSVHQFHRRESTVRWIASGRRHRCDDIGAALMMPGSGPRGASRMVHSHDLTRRPILLRVPWSVR
jgi:hypothetical protein